MTDGVTVVAVNMEDTIPVLIDIIQVILPLSVVYYMIGWC